MRTTPAMIAALAVTLGAAGAAKAQEADVAPDLRCFLVASILASATDDATAKQSLGAMASYYLGRLDGRAPKLDLETRVPAELAKLSPPDYRTEAARCAAETTARRAAIAAIGEKLKAKPPAQ